MKLIRHHMWRVGIVLFLVCILCGLLLVSGVLSRAPQKNALQAVTSIATKCNASQVSSARMVCWQQALVPVVNTWGMKPVLETVETMYIRSDDAQNGGITKCHDIAHAIGRIGGAQSTNLAKTFAQCTNLCGYGCYMGIVDGYLAKKGIDFTREITSICKNTTDPLPCTHALGHVVGDRVGAIVPSLHLCDKLTDEQERLQCTTGVFMELYESPNFGHVMLPIPSDISAFCAGLWGVHQSFCYGNAGYFTYLQNKDLDKSIAYCATLPSQYTNSCTLLLTDQIYYVYDGSAPDIQSYCSKFPTSDLQFSCIDAALFKSVISDPIARHGFALCGRLTGPMRSKCFASLGDKIEGNDRTKTKRGELCGQLASLDQEYCLEKK